MIPYRVVLVVALSLIAAAPIAARAEPQPAAAVSVPFTAEKGKVARYRYERTDMAPAPDGAAPTVRGTYTSDATFRVLDILPQGYRIALTIDTSDGTMANLDKLGVDQAVMSKVLGAVIGVTMVYVTDEGGNPLTIENLEDVRAANGKAIASLRESIAASELPAEARDAVEKMVAAMAKLYADMTPEQAMQVLLKDTATLFTMGGIELAPGEEAEFEQQVPSPVGGPPIKTRNRAWLSNVSDGQVTVELRSIVDPASVKATQETVTAALLKQYGDKLPEQARAALATMDTFAINDSLTAVLGRSDGWPVRVDVERSSTSASVTRLEKRTFTRLP